MNDAGDRTELFHAWTHRIDTVSVSEVLDFSAYAGLSVFETIRRLAEAGVTIDPARP